MTFLATLNPEKFGYIIDALQQCKGGVDLQILRSTCGQILDDEVRRLTARIDVVSKHGQEWGIPEYKDEWTKERKRLLALKTDLIEVLKEDGENFNSVIQAVKS